jgi:excisionase family DNA binding protein
MTMATTSEQLLTVEELCRMWKVDRQWVYRQTHRGSRQSLPVVRLGRLLRFRSSELDEWLRRNKFQFETGGQR